MAEISEPWKNVASKAEALGLKLKLHLEQERDDDAPGEPGETKAVIEDLGRKLQETFDSMGAAAKDPAVRTDFKDMGSLFKDALTETFSSVSSDVGDAMRKTTDRTSGDTDADNDTQSDTEGGDTGSGDDTTDSAD